MKILLAFLLVVCSSAMAQVTPIVQAKIQQDRNRIMSDTQRITDGVDAQTDIVNAQNQLQADTAELAPAQTFDVQQNVVQANQVNQIQLSS